MSGPENKQPDDTALEEFLAGRSEVSQAYGAVAKEAPPAELDTAVIDFARREAARAPAPGRFRRAGLVERWRWPVAAAAMMVLSFSVLNQVRHDREARQATMLESSAPTGVSLAPPPAPLAEAPALAADATAPGTSGEMLAGAGTPDANFATEVQEAPPAAPPPPEKAAPSSTREGSRREPAKAKARAPVVVPAEPPAESDAAVVAPKPAPAPPPPAAEPFPAAPSAAQARVEEGRRKRLADQAEMQRSDGEAERRVQMEAEAKAGNMAKEEGQGFAAQSAGSVAGPADAVQAFLQRPSVQRLPSSGVILKQSQRLLRQGRRRADGTCDFPSPPQGSSGATVIELHLAVDIDTCEVLVERGYR